MTLYSPPIAFVLFVVITSVLYGGGKLLAGTSQRTGLKSSTYSSGEAPPERVAAPGYRPFFVVALFFAILHLGVLVLGTGGLTPMTGIYLVGLALSLVALIRG